MPADSKDGSHHDSPGLDRFEMVRRAPSHRLQGVVTDMCGFRETMPGHFRAIEYASLTVPLVISFAEPFAIGLGRDPSDNDRFASFAAGLYAGPVVIESCGGTCCMQVNFTPLGARRFFGRPMSELTDRMVGLDDVLGVEGIAFRERLGNAPDWSSRFAIAEAFVGDRLATADRTQADIVWAYETIVSTRGRTRISTLAEKLGWSRKHLNGKFSDAIGTGPKNAVAHCPLQPCAWAVETVEQRLGRHRRRLRLCRPGASGTRVSRPRRRRADGPCRQVTFLQDAQPAFAQTGLIDQPAEGDQPCRTPPNHRGFIRRCATGMPAR